MLNQMQVIQIKVNLIRNMIQKLITKFEKDSILANSTSISVSVQKIILVLLAPTRVAVVNVTSKILPNLPKI